MSGDRRAQLLTWAALTAATLIAAGATALGIGWILASTGQQAGLDVADAGATAVLLGFAVLTPIAVITSARRARRDPQ